MRASTQARRSLLQACDLGLGETLAGEVAQGRPPPERQRLGRSPTLLQLAETIQIELSLVDAEEVARGLGLDPFPAQKLP
jgi:hypothetical protein